ncbi:MAG: PTS sugar transporter subunit IIA [Alphaproteobacteria bacterium]|nr:PTS sugar transporter subunit IIA [Alphaproteobacteria bacterium]
MIGLVLVTHGDLGKELLLATEHVCGEQKLAKAISIGPDDDMEQRRAEILQAVLAVDKGRGVVVITDMFGGTPSNLALSIIEKAHIEVLAGANLPMMIKLASVRSTLNLDEAVAEAQEAGRKYITVASQLLNAKAS